MSALALSDSPLTAARLREVLHYDPAAGVFTWRKSPRRGWVGKQAGTQTTTGYIAIKIGDNAPLLAHRLAWLYMTGEWPPEQIDHIDGVGTHNWWANLRSADSQLNQANSRKPRNNTSGHKGVYWDPDLGKWRAKLNVGSRQIHLGCFDDAAAAGAAYEAGAKRHFGEYARAE